MNIHVLPIDIDSLEEVWPSVRPNFERYCALETNRDTVENYWQKLMSGQNQLWVVWDVEGRKVMAAVVTVINVAANGEKYAAILMVEGTGRNKWVDLTINRIENWAVEQNCVSLMIQARKAWMRLLKDYTIQRYVIEKKLEGTEQWAASLTQAKPPAQPQQADLDRQDLAHKVG